MPRFLHTADWQIGRQYGQFDPDDAAVIAEARFAAIETLAALASARACDAVLVAGDVFDSQTVSDRTLRRLFLALQAFNGPWIMISGNHDAALGESVWQRAQRLGIVPANVHLALEPSAVPFPAQGFTVLAAPLTQRHTYDDLTGWFDQAVTDAGLIRIGVAHGAVQGVLAEEVDSPNPIAPDRADRARLDYLALGDWHGTKSINARTWYSGTPEQDRFKANDAGNVLLVDIDKPGAEPVVMPVPTGKFSWVQEQRTLRVASDVDVLAQWLYDLGASTVLDLRVDGDVDLASHQQLLNVIEQARGKLRSVRCDFGALRLLPTEEDIAALHADGYLAEVISELRDQQATGDNAVAADALAILAGLLQQRSSTGASA